jgi:hypothetical protein
LSVCVLATSLVASFAYLGSPLAIGAIRERVPRDRPPGRAPHGVRAWRNGRDARDTVALHEIDSSLYCGSSVVRDDSAVQNGRTNHHGIAEYLQDRVVVRAIFDGLFN